MVNIDKRLSDLENRSSGGPVIVVYWGDGFVTVDDERITIDEFHRRYPDHKTITWDDDDYAADPVPA